MLHKIGLEEHYAIPETLGGSMVYFKDFTGQTDMRATRVLDLLDLRLKEMDEHGMDFMILSLNSPAIQEIYQVSKAVEISKLANDKLYEAITQKPDRFMGFASLPLQDPDEAIKEMHRAVKELGFVGVLVNGYSQIGDEHSYKYLDDPMYLDFWAELEKIDVPFYLHPREPMPCNTGQIEGHPWIHGAPWAFGVETATHTLRLMCSGLFDKFPKLKVLMGHLGEGLPFLVWRCDHFLQKRSRGIPAKKTMSEYLNENIWVTTSGQFHLPPLLCTMLQMGTDRILFATDYPFEDVSEACAWFDSCPVSEGDRKKIGRQNAIDLFRLKL